MNYRSSRSRFEWMSPWLEMCGCITPFALSWQNAGRLYDKLSWWNYTVKSAKRTKNRFIILFRRFNVSYRLFRMMFDVGYLLFFYAEVVETDFFFVSQNIYTRYTKNLGGKWLETPPWNCRHSNFPEDTKQGPRTNYCTVLLTFDCRKVIFSSSKMSHITAKY